MRAAAADLDFEEAARLRDEIKRLRATELAVIDDPTAKFLPSPGGGGPPRRSAQREGVPDGASRIRKPTLDDMGIALHHEVAPHRPGASQRNQPKPTVDESAPTKKEFSSGPRSTLGRPGMRGGWKPRRR
jgi:excinuclease ABC subunit B